MFRTSALLALLALSVALAGCEEKPENAPDTDGHAVGADDDDFDESDFEVPAECEDEFEAADACWENAESDEDFDACMELEDALAECAGWDDCPGDDDDSSDDDDWGDDDDYEDGDDGDYDDLPWEECESELEAADACWEAAETDEEIDACIPLEDALLDCLGVEDDPVEAQ